MAAAVADYAPSASTDRKLKKSAEKLTIELERTIDVLASVEGPRVRVGFAAETENLIENARRKLVDKRLDLVVANAIGGEESPFGSDVNRAILIDSKDEEELPLLAKRALAEKILDRVCALLDGR